VSNLARYYVGVCLADDDARYQVIVNASGKRAAIYQALDLPGVEQVTGCTTFTRPGHITWQPETAAA
jgi:hypothetical protein